MIEGSYETNRIPSVKRMLCSLFNLVPQMMTNQVSNKYAQMRQVNYVREKALKRRSGAS